MTWWLFISVRFLAIFFKLIYFLIIYETLQSIVRRQPVENSQTGAILIYINSSKLDFQAVYSCRCNKVNDSHNFRLLIEPMASFFRAGPACVDPCWISWKVKKISVRWTYILLLYILLFRGIERIKGVGQIPSCHFKSEQMVWNHIFQYGNNGRLWLQ